MDCIKELKTLKANGSEMLDPFGGKMKKSFVLPDYQQVFKGFVKEDDAPITEDEQVLSMERERFCIPEILFRPSDIGIEQAGIAEATWQSFECLPKVISSLV